MTVLWITLAAVGVAMTLIGVGFEISERRRHRRIARAHEPRPLPSTRDLVGSAPDITEGRNAADHIRRLRRDD